MGWPGICHCWLLPPEQSHWLSRVPSAVPHPQTSTHRPEFAFRSEPSDSDCQVCAPDELQSYSCRATPFAVDEPGTSRHLPSARIAPLSTVQDCADVPL